MTSSALPIVHSYLLGEYGARLGKAISNNIPQDGEPGTVTWIWQNGALKSVGQESDATGAVLIDSEIGKCLFLQVFDKDTDLKGQMARALSVKSQLLPRFHPEGFQNDLLGEWSISVVWLCEPTIQSDWIQKAASLRNETAYFEEVPVDLLVNDANEWVTSIRAYAFPRLLLKMREALRRKDQAEAYDWLNADPIIRQKLLTALLKGNDEWGPFGTLVLNHLKSLPDKSIADCSDNPTTPLLRVEARKFRNIGTLDLSLRTSEQSVSANIIQGPNGTGKSAISEAISFALGQVSSRYLEYLDDSNEPAAGKAQKYARVYLAPLNEVDAAPEIRLNGEGGFGLVLANPEEARAKCAHLSGTLLSQSWAQHLSRISAEELGSVIAGNYSQLASKILEFVETNLTNAEGERTAFNREWGLRANVTRGKTAMLRIATTILDSVLPDSHDLHKWAESGSQYKWLFQDAFRSLDTRLKTWAAQAQARAKLVADTDIERLGEVLHEFFHERNSILEESQRLHLNVVKTAISAGSVSPDLVNQIKLWGDWLRRPIEKPLQPDSKLIIQARQRVDECQASLEIATSQGTQLRERRDQIQSVLNFVELHWASGHPNDCPVCSSDLRSRGGVVEVLHTTSDQLSREIEVARVRFLEIREQLTAATSHLSSVTQEVEPLTVDQLTSLRISLATLVSLDFSLDTLRDPDLAGRVCALWAFASERRSLLQPIDPSKVQDAAYDSAKKMSSALQRFTAISEAPEQWKRLSSSVSKVLAQSIEEHLPQTMQALWLEIAKTMMPAPWQYPGPVKFSVNSRKNGTEARLVLNSANKSGLAAHILNNAELHNLGLAWFFARYLTHGRFHYTAMVLDDPAGQMDQPSFRDFCRYLEATLRLHKLYSLPLTLVLFLHQDDRALAAARTTDATIHFLGWHKGASSIMKRMKTRTLPVAPALPYKIPGISFG